MADCQSITAPPAAPMAPTDRLQDIAGRLVDLRSLIYHIGTLLQSCADEFTTSPDRVFAHREVFQRGLLIQQHVSSLERYADEIGAMADVLDPPAADSSPEVIA